MNQSDISGGSVEEKRRIKERAWKGPTKKKTWFSEDVEIFLIVEIEKEYENRRVGYLTRWIKSLGGMQRHEVTYLWSPSQKNFFFFSFCSRWLRVLRTTVSEKGWRAKEGIRRVSRKSRHDLWSDSWTDICSASISRPRASNSMFVGARRGWECRQVWGWASHKLQDERSKERWGSVHEYETAK